MQEETTVPEAELPKGTIDPSRTRRRILDAAEELYLDRGVAATTLSAVARRAGVSRPTVYKHFGDAQSLAGVLVDGHVAAYFELVAEVIEAQSSTRDRLVEGLAFTVEYALEHRLLQRLLLLEPEAVLTTFTTAAEPLLARAVALLEPELADAVERGEVRGIAPDVAAEWVARIALSLVLTPSVTRDLSDPAELRRYLTSLLVGGLGAAREPGARELR
jgi:AcrR family transcriptional regulator